MHRLSSSFVLGYHGCDREVAEKILAGDEFTASQNEYDWLGWGIYFWEANPLRGMEFANEWAGRGKIKDPYVIGAVIDLGFCLDLTTSTGVAAVKATYEDFAAYVATAGKSMPENRFGNDRLLRELDCAVINHLHQVRETINETPFQTVKGIFVEGDEIYPGAGFYANTHTQICVRDVNCIKGAFRVPNEHLYLDA